MFSLYLIQRTEQKGIQRNNEHLKRWKQNPSGIQKRIVSRKMYYCFGKQGKEGVGLTQIKSPLSF
jgi:hypothetical protein